MERTKKTGSTSDLHELVALKLTEVLGEDVVTGSSSDDETRPARMVLKRISDKWSLLVLGTLRDGPLRFSGIVDALPGVSSRMLVATLRSLERDGFVTRTIYAEVPPRVEYATTELGRSLLPELNALLVWAYDHCDEITVNRRRYDREH